MPKTKSNEYPTLLICYEAGDGTMDMPYVLKKGGCHIDVYSKKESWLIKNKIYNNWIPAPPHEDEFIEKLIEIILKGSYKWIIPIDDESVRILNKKISDRELFQKIIPLCFFENKMFLGSKIELANVCKQNEIIIPNYIVLEKQLTPEIINTKIGFPLLIKEDESGGGVGIKLCKNIEELKMCFLTLQDSKKHIIQEFIQGEEISCEALFKNGQLLVANTSKILDSIKTFGYSLKREYFRDEKLIVSIEIIGKRLGLNGFCNITSIFDKKTKTHYLLEIDSRPNAWFRFGEFTGNDFSVGVKKYINDDLTLLIPENQPEKIIITLFKRDLASVLNNKGFLKIIFWLINKDNCWKYIPFFDSKLLWANIWFLTIRYLRWALKKIGFSNKK